MIDRYLSPEEPEDEKFSKQQPDDIRRSIDHIPKNSGTTIRLTVSSADADQPSAEETIELGNEETAAFIHVAQGLGMRSLEQAYGTILRFLMAADVQEQQRFRDASTIDKKIAILKAFIDSSVGISRAEEQEDPSENWDDGPWNSDYSFNDGEQWTPRAE